MRVDGPEVNPATCEPQAGRAHADRADTGHDLALGQNARGEPAFADLPLSKSRRAVFLQAQDSQRFKLVEGRGRARSHEAAPLVREEFFNGIHPTRTFNDHSRSSVRRSGSPPKYLCKASLNTWLSDVALANKVIEE